MTRYKVKGDFASYNRNTSDDFDDKYEEVDEEIICSANFASVLDFLFNSRDGGVDITIVKDPIERMGNLIRYSNPNPHTLWI